MPTVKVRNLRNEEVGDLELTDAVFGVPLNQALIHAAVRNFMANARQGTVGTKTRGDVSGAGRKLWRQKGTGRARIASLRSPLWKGGGNVHGPQPRDWSYNLPRKMRRGALRSALSERVREGSVIVVDAWKLEQPKTKEFVAQLGKLGLGDRKTLIVDSRDNEALLLSSRNVQRTKVVSSFALNIYDLLYHEALVISRAAVNELEGLLGAKGAVAEDEAAPEVAAETDTEAPAPAAKKKPAAKRAAKKAAPKAAKRAAKKAPAKKAKAGSRKKEGGKK
jgi:large subunit ribosomal protein L4